MFSLFPLIVKIRFKEILLEIGFIEEMRFA